jgi:hypothetical protein
MGREREAQYTALVQEIIRQAGQGVILGGNATSSSTQPTGDRHRNTTPRQNQSTLQPSAPEFPSSGGGRPPASHLIAPARSTSGRYQSEDGRSGVNGGKVPPASCSKVAIDNLGQSGPQREWTALTISSWARGLIPPSGHELTAGPVRDDHSPPRARQRALSLDSTATSPSIASEGHPGKVSVWGTRGR